MPNGISVLDLHESFTPDDQGFVYFFTADGKHYKIKLENLLAGGVVEGDDGLSAYEIAVANGYVGTEMEWLASLAINGADYVTLAGDEQISGEKTHSGLVKTTIDPDDDDAFLPSRMLDGRVVFFSEMERASKVSIAMDLLLTDASTGLIRVRSGGRNGGSAAIYNQLMEFSVTAIKTSGEAQISVFSNVGHTTAPFYIKKTGDLASGVVIEIGWTSVSSVMNGGCITITEGLKNMKNPWGFTVVKDLEDDASALGGSLGGVPQSQPLATY